MKNVQLLLSGLIVGLIILPLTSKASTMKPSEFTFANNEIWLWLLFLITVILLFAAIIIREKITLFEKEKEAQKNKDKILEKHIQKLSSEQIDKVFSVKYRSKNRTLLFLLIALSVFSFLSSTQAYAAIPIKPNGESLLSEGGIILTLALILIPVLFGLIFLMVRISSAIHQYSNKIRLTEAQKLAAYIEQMPAEALVQQLAKRKEATEYKLTQQELSGTTPAVDKKGLLEINQEPGLPIVNLKKKALPRPHIDPRLSRLVIWYLVAATFWLLFGTTVGEYLGIKFVAPDADHLSWLSFGRLRPVHTNAVFWGWGSLGMLGLGYYIVPRVGNVAIHSIKMGWYSLLLINLAVIIGTLCLMGGINNGGGEYREYVWPVMALFGIGLIITLVNFIKTIATRKTKEIYISNWYMVSAIIFTLVITLVAYLPFWQNGLGETIVQGYYMHQGVGMWFMLFTLGIVYYFLPQQLNKPIYSYSLGVLAFWTQILFYTLIGTHHFVFSAIPWWLQTVAIVGSAGMAIPVIAGTTNFLMTFQGDWHKLKTSYTLPFFLVGIIFYFTGSMQGTAEAFRFTNLVWHFTDFTVAHSHLTMYGIISFFLWACIYAVLPRLTGKEAPQITIGAHFWLALTGLMFYSIPLMYGGTLKGLMWMEGKPFIDSVSMMMPYWLWRAIGGSLMWLSHIFFAYNMYKMILVRKEVDVREVAIQYLEKNANQFSKTIA